VSTSERSFRPAASANAVADAPAEPHTALGPPQFRLATLLAAMAAISAVFAVMHTVGIGWSLVMLLFVSLVSAHIAGNALGTRLRDQATAECRVAARLPIVQTPAATIVVGDGRRWIERTKLGWLTIACAALGAVVGGSLGACVGMAYEQQQTAAGMALVTCSLATVGGLMGFLASSFFIVLRRAMGEALGSSDATPSDRRAAGSA